MKNIKADIVSGKYKRVYLLYGDEFYLLRRCVASLKKGVLGDDGSDVNFTSFDGSSGYDVNELKEICQTLPFFAERRLVIVENSGLFGGDSGFDAFIPQIPDSTVLILIEHSADKKTKLYKAIKEGGYVCEFTTPTPDQAIEFCAGYLGKAGKRISRDDCTYFENGVGGDLYNISTELDKLIDYTGDADTVRRADIDAICSMQIENKIFDIVDSLMSGSFKDALKIYHDLISLREQPLGILRFIVARYLRLLGIRDEIDRGRAVTEAASNLKMPDWLFKKEKAKLKDFSSAKLLKAIELCTDTENLIKTGDIADSAGLEILLANLSAL